MADGVLTSGAGELRRRWEIGAREASYPLGKLRRGMSFEEQGPDRTDNGEKVAVPRE